MLLVLLLTAVASLNESAEAVAFPAAFSVSPGGGASLQGFADIRSTFAGRHSLTAGRPDAADGQGQYAQGQGWQSLAVDRSAEPQGVIAVRAVAARFELERRYIAAPSKHGSDTPRLLINDTFTCKVGAG